MDPLASFESEKGFIVGRKEDRNERNMKFLESADLSEKGDWYNEFNGKEIVINLAAQISAPEYDAEELPAQSSLQYQRKGCYLLPGYDKSSSQTARWIQVQGFPACWAVQIFNDEQSAINREYAVHAGSG